MKDSSTMAQNLPKKETNEKTLTSERENVMVPLSADGIPTLRTAHFLKPSLNPKNQAKPPSISPCTNPNFIQFLQKRVAFKGRQVPLDHWEAWVGSLQKTHEELWKKVGIFDAIRVSTYRINRQNDLIFGLAEKWCPETKSFVFPWGETTITLEDVMISGGFPVVGSSVRSPFRGENVEMIKAKLGKACSRIRKTCKNQVHHKGWMEHFRGKGGELEHVAFLMFWLSRYVFPTSHNIIVLRDNFDVAITLAKGIKVAIAPAVLASIYRDLGLLKEKIVAFSKDGVDDGSELKLWAAFQLVQVWAWERFPTLSPKPLQLVYGRPRMARWNHVSCGPRTFNHSLIMESSEDQFLWRPYGVKMENWEFPEFYSNEGMWVSINFEVNVGLLSFALCLRDCELVGFDCVEQYLPHRVALQFGYDQDVPVTVPRSNANHKLAWSSYAIPLDGYRFYIPPRLLEGDVTMEYSRWWKSSLSLPEDELLVYGSKRRSWRKVKKLSQILQTSVKEKVPPFPPRQCSEVNRLYPTRHNSKEIPMDKLSSCEDMNPLIVEEDSSRYERLVAVEEDKETEMDGSSNRVDLQGSVDSIGAESPQSSLCSWEAMSSYSVEESESLSYEKSLFGAYPVGNAEDKGEEVKPSKGIHEPVMSKTGKFMGLESKKPGSLATQIEHTISSENVDMMQAYSSLDVFLQGSVKGIKPEAMTQSSHLYNDTRSIDSVENSKELAKEKSVSCEGMATLSPTSVRNLLIGLDGSVKYEHPTDMEEDKDEKLNENDMILNDGSKNFVGSSGNESSKSITEVLMSETEELSWLDMNMSGSRVTEVEQITHAADVDMKHTDSLDVAERSYIGSPIEALDLFQHRMDRLARVWAIYKDAKFGSS